MFKIAPLKQSKPVKWHNPSEQLIDPKLEINYSPIMGELFHVLCAIYHRLIENLSSSSNLVEK